MNGIQGELKAILKGLKDVTKKAASIGKKIEKMEKAPTKKAAAKAKAARKATGKVKSVKRATRKSVK